jgi:branched-chain amino acid aminotransferase
MGHDSRWVWVGGQDAPLPHDQATIAATDLAYLYGCGLYETLRTYHSRPFALAEHLRRLEVGASRSLFPELPLDEMASALEGLASKRLPHESYLRLAVSPGRQFPDSVGFPEGPAAWTAFAGPLAPHNSAVYERGVRCVLSSRPRWNPSGLVPAVKFSSNAEIRVAKREAEIAGAYEALLLNPGGWLAEGSSSNVFLVKGKALVTPDLASGILDGVTRAILLKLGQKAGIPAEERPVSASEIYEAEEVFIASTLKEVVPVVQVGDRLIGEGRPGLITDRLLGLYQEYALENTLGDTR